MTEAETRLIDWIRNYHYRSMKLPAFIDDLQAVLYELKRLREIELAVALAHSQHADDLCWMDIDKIFTAAGLPVPDRTVGDPEAMLKNCRRFVQQFCRGGGPWKSYAELEAEVERLRGPVQVNFNQAIRVRLTNYGRQVHRDRYELSYENLRLHSPYVPPAEDAGGWSEWQLWRLMSIFGHCMGLGREQPFEMAAELPKPKE